MGGGGGQGLLALLLKRPAGDLPLWIWLGLPLSVVALCLLMPLLGYERWHRLMLSEFGLIEIATIAMLVPSVVLAGLIVVRGRRGALPGVVLPCMILGGLAALYFAGEEASWGQHFFGFQTPQSVAEGNFQKEFNLHNSNGVMRGLFDNVPRQLMLLGTIAGGIVLPFVRTDRRLSPQSRRTAAFWIIPTRGLVPTALLAATCNIPGKILESMHYVFDPKAVEKFTELHHVPQAALAPIRIVPDPAGYWSMAFIQSGGELKECFFAMVMLLYFWSVHHRLRHPPSA